LELHIHPPASGQLDPQLRVYDEEKLPETVAKIVNLVGLKILHQAMPLPSTSAN
jgi:hypothetical protein